MVCAILAEQGSMEDATKNPIDTELLGIITDFRGEIKNIAMRVKMIKRHEYFGSAHTPASKADDGEMIADIMLAYRHLEDACMRLGKVFEAYFGEGIGNGPFKK